MGHDRVTQHSTGKRESSTGVHALRELEARIIAAGKFVYGPLCARLEVALQEALCAAGRVVLTRSGHPTEACIGWEVAYKHPVSEYVAYRNGAGSSASRMPAGGTPPAYKETDSMINTASPIRVGTPVNLWGSIRPDEPIFVLPGVQERAFCILYLAPEHDRTSALTREKLGYAVIAVLLADPNKAVNRWVDFEGLAFLRRRMAARLVVITWSPRLTLLALWWRCPVYQTVKQFVEGYNPALTREQASHWLLAVPFAAWRYAASRLRRGGRDPTQALPTSS